MSRSSAREGGPGPGGRQRGQTEPLAALAAVLVVCAGLALYAGVLGTAVPATDRDLASPTLNRVHERLTDAGVVVTDRVSAATAAAPDGRRVTVSVSTRNRTWRAGPTPPDVSEGGRVDAAARTVAVRVAPGRVVAGRLRVVVWP